jgi:hypothetical protein
MHLLEKYLMFFNKNFQFVTFGSVRPVLVLNLGFYNVVYSFFCVLEVMPVCLSVYCITCHTEAVLTEGREADTECRSSFDFNDSCEEMFRVNKNKVVTFAFKKQL